MIDLHKLFAKSYFTSETSLYTHSDLHYCVRLSRPITQPIFIQHTVCLNNASKVNQSSCNSILCKPYLFALGGGQVVLSSAGRGWGPQPDNTSPPLISLKSPMCRKASYLLNGLSIVWLYKGEINLNSSFSSNFTLESGNQLS